MEQTTYTDKIGDLFRNSFEFFQKNWRILIPITIIPFALVGIAEIISFYQTPSAKTWNSIFTFLASIASLIMTPAILDAIDKIHKNENNINLKDQYRVGLKFFFPFLLVMILQVFSVIGGLFLLVIPGVIVAVYMSFYLYTLVLENKRGINSLERSYEIIRGRWLKVLWRHFLVGLLGPVSTFLALQLVVVLNLFGIMPFVAHSIGALITAALMACIAIISSCYLYNYYNFLKNTAVIDEISNKKFKTWIWVLFGIGVVGTIIGIVVAIIIGVVSKAI